MPGFMEYFIFGLGMFFFIMGLIVVLFALVLISEAILQQFDLSAWPSWIYVPIVIIMSPGLYILTLDYLEISSFDRLIVRHSQFMEGSPEPLKYIVDKMNEEGGLSGLSLKEIEESILQANAALRRYEHDLKQKAKENNFLNNQIMKEEELLSTLKEEIEKTNSVHQDTLKEIIEIVNPKEPIFSLYNFKNILLSGLVGFFIGVLIPYLYNKVTVTLRRV